MLHASAHLSTSEFADTYWEVSPLALRKTISLATRTVIITWTKPSDNHDLVGGYFTDNS